MTSKQRAYLKGLAMKLDTIFQIGKSGVTDEICNQLLNALNARELIKIKILETCPTGVKETASLIAEGTGADIVHTIGLKIVLFRVSDNEKNRTIDINKIR